MVRLNISNENTVKLNTVKLTNWREEYSDVKFLKQYSHVSTGSTIYEKGIVAMLQS